MPLFNWNEKFVTGIQTIDEQHGKLVSLVNELHEAMRQRKAKEIIERILEELARYTAYHFTVEERAFDEYGYAGAAAHRKAHADFSGKVGDLTARHKKGEIALSVSILDFLVDWVTQHILKEDMQYVPFLKDKAIF